MTRRSDNPAPVEGVWYRSSRWAASDVSFGPVVLWFSPLGGVLFLVVWSAVVVPRGLRDVWRGVRVRR
ncbi:hypothetical protein AB2L27_01115 [Kineococcus sp. LSe6-4]|uniref:Uncharacterized protein n=1 Tax=Kineococcus halophytocola TaxID=3234027 RepID=A0ABV4GVM0_9ACTN